MPKKTTIYLLFILLSVSSQLANAQTYFPPIATNSWDTISPASLSWCQGNIDSLYEFLDSNSTKAFILLKDGKIVLEQYFDGHSDSSNWYWASAGKTITSLLVGIAQQEGDLNIWDISSQYLGQGWTDCTLAQEGQISIWNQLTMTSGLDDGVPDPFCTLDTCLQYLVDASTRWAYHNAPYTLLDGVIENATGVGLNVYTFQKVLNPIGMNGLFIPQGYNNLFFSTARSMARFGLLIQNQGNWDGMQIISDSIYFNQMINTSQTLNESYGYLWWLNGKNSFMLPQSQIVFPGSFSPSAPPDMIAAVGKNGQFINISPSENMVWIRMGDSPDNSLVPILFGDEIWQHINALDCSANNISDRHQIENKYELFPNPTKDFVKLSQINSKSLNCDYFLHSPLGKIVKTGQITGENDIIDVRNLSRGIYLLKLDNDDHHQTIQISVK